MLEAFIQKTFLITQVAVGLGLLIFIHEFGHFIMAKKNGVRVEAFSFGFWKVLFRWKIGETEYRLSAIPWGGYVKMAAELPSDERKGEPWEFSSKTPWQKFEVFVAGALMNVLIGFPLAILAFLVGRYEFSNEVGIPGVPEARAGMKPGDVIVQAGGRKIENMDKYRIEMVRRFRNSVVPVTVRRGGQEVVLQVKTMGSLWHAQTRSPSRMIGYIRPGSPAEEAGLRELDEVMEADGRPLLSWKHLDEALRNNPAKPVRLTIRRRDGDWNASLSEVVLTAPPKEIYSLPEDPHLFQCVVGAVVNGMPAWDLLEPGDRIVRLDDREVHSWQDLKDVVENSFGRPVRFTVRREDKVLEKPVEIVPAYGDTGAGAIGIKPGGTRVFARVTPGSAYEKAGLRSGDELYSAPRKNEDGEWQEDVTGKRDADLPVSHLFTFQEKGPRTLRIQVRRDGKLVRIDLPLEKRVEGDLVALGVAGPGGALGFESVRAFRRRSLGAAVSAGLREPVDVVLMTFEIIGKLVSNQESMRNLSGPVGIFHVSMRFVELSFGNFLWLLCMITVNLGVFNVLPIPLLDGGQMVLLLVEKLRGRPPSQKFLAAFQSVGILFIIVLILFVTFNDITRLIRGG